MCTPVIYLPETNVWLKRNDLFTFAGLSGGKVRAALLLIQAAKEGGHGGVTTAGSRASPQIRIVATIANVFDLVCKAYCPQGPLSPEMDATQRQLQKMFVLEQIFPGCNTVIVKRSMDFAASDFKYK